MKFKIYIYGAAQYIENVLSSQHQHAQYTYRTELLELQEVEFNALSVYTLHESVFGKAEGALTALDGRHSWRYEWLMTLEMRVNVMAEGQEQKYF